MQQHQHRGHGEAAFCPQSIIPDPIAVMAAGTVQHPATGRIIAVQLELGNHTEEGGAAKLPLLSICCIVSEATQTARMFPGDAHRESGVFSYRSALSPVESCSPPELCELTPDIYSWEGLNASEG
jgi:hypothetical protein